MQSRGIISALITLGVGIGVGTTILRVDNAHATGLAQPSIVVNTAADPVSVRDQNVYVPATNAASSSYASGFRAAYLPVYAALTRVSGACPSVSRVQQLPACGARVAPFRVALAHLLRFVTQTTPPASANTDVRTLATTIRVLQQRFTTLAALIKRNDLARFKAMGGQGHPIDIAITAFGSAVGNVVIDVPGLRIPVPWQPLPGVGHPASSLQVPALVPMTPHAPPLSQNAGKATKGRVEASEPVSGR
jgi:hypothetical protein